MLKDFTKEIPEEWFYAALGLETEEECKLCGSPLMANDLGDKWCSGIKCSWANNEMLIEFKQGLINALKDYERKGGVMLEYDIIVKESIVELKQEVNRWLQDGWKPQGGMYRETITTLFGEKVSLCYQAVIREYNANPKS